MAISDVPVKNWREAQWAEGMDALSGVTVAEKIMTKTHACYGCPVACKRVVKIDAGPFKMEEGPGLEYEGAAALGTLQRCADLDERDVFILVPPVGATATANGYGATATVDCVFPVALSRMRT